MRHIQTLKNFRNSLEKSEATSEHIRKEFVIEWLNVILAEYEAENLPDPDPDEPILL